MTVDEVRVRLRRKLEAAFGVEEATVLMDTSTQGVVVAAFASVGALLRFA